MDSTSENIASKSGLAFESILDYRKRTGKSVEELRSRDYAIVAMKACKAAGFDIRFIVCRYDAHNLPVEYKVLIHTTAKKSSVAVEAGIAEGTAEADGGVPEQCGEDQLAALTDALRGAGFTIIEATAEQFYAGGDFSTVDVNCREFREVRVWVKPGTEEKKDG